MGSFTVQSITETEPVVFPAADAMQRPQPNVDTTRSLLTVNEVAALLGVSQSWVRRHIYELPVVRLGCLVRFDSTILTRKCKLRTGKSLKPERRQMPSRFQRGSVFQIGKQRKVWYGLFREDVRKPDGGIIRRQRKVRLGTRAELPTTNAARNRLSEVMNDSSSPPVDMSFQELAERWQKAEGPTMKPSTLCHYANALRTYVVPVFGDRTISGINREDVQLFINEQAKRYSKSTLRSMRVVISLSLGWAKNCSWIEVNPCAGIRLPKENGGRTVKRTVLSFEQISAIASRLKEPYATLVLFLAATGLRIGEAIAVKWSDFDKNVLHVTRRIFDGSEDTVKTGHSKRDLPIDPELVSRMRDLGDGEWIFRSRNGSPLNPGNALKRYVRPAAQIVGVDIGGWHDFRHTATTRLRRNGVHPKVISGILGHSKVDLAEYVYDHVDFEEFREPLSVLAGELLPNVTKKPASA